MRTRIHLLRWMLVLCALFMTRPLAAQLCVGVPLNTGQMALAGTAAFPDGGDIYGARVSYRPSSLAALRGFYQLENYAGEGIDNGHRVGGDLAIVADSVLSFGSLIGGRRTGFCPRAGVNMFFQGDNTTLEVPVSINLGAEFPTGFGSINPFLSAGGVFSRFSGEGASDSQLDPAFAAGANLFVNSLFFGVAAEKQGEQDTTFGLTAGVQMESWW